MNVTGSAAAPGSEAAISASASTSRPWLKSYPPKVPHTIDETQIGTLVDFFRHGVTAYAGRPAVESFGKQMTYAELGREAAKVASWLQSRGIGKGDRVAIMLPNVMAYPPILYG
ncbi:MAG: AMP-binding protein, partial [Microvirga sp.]|nr:AMP-binding protein [Microvirga sp.]